MTTDARPAEVERLRAALDACDQATYGWSFGTVSTVIDKIRLTARAALDSVNDEPINLRAYVAEVELAEAVELLHRWTRTSTRQWELDRTEFLNRINRLPILEEKP